MLRTVRVIVLSHQDMIVPCYEDAMNADGATLLVEMTELYKNERGNG